jgi:hypothetical protein
MRRIWIVLLLSLGIQVVAPVPAHAQIWRWIYELSGPGPFTGWEFEWRLVCFSEREGDEPPAAPAASTGRERAARALGVLAPGCFVRPVPREETRRASINVSFGLFDARENNLRYARGSTDHDVTLTSIEPTVWWRPAAAVEVGAGVGVFWFSGPDFRTFRRLFFEPFRIDARPVALLGDLFAGGHPEWTELLSLRAGAIVIPHGFRADDFGAIRGTFQTSREVLHTFSVFVDLEPVVRYLRRPRPDGPVQSR